METLYTEIDVAKLFSLSVETLRQWRSRGKGPIFYKLGGAVRYRASDLETYLKSCQVNRNRRRAPGRPRLGT